LKTLFVSAVLLLSAHAWAAPKTAQMTPGQIQDTVCPSKTKEKGKARKVYCTDPASKKEVDYAQCGENGITCVIISSGETVDVCGTLFSCP